jgi:hypothetical protein
MSRSDIVFEFQSGFQMNSLIWVSSLRSDDGGTTDRILEDLEPTLSRISLPFFCVEPASAEHFKEILGGLAEAAERGMRPVLHLDMHGSKEEGVQIAATGEYVPWKVVFDHLRPINIQTRNNFCVIATVCFGFNVILPPAVSFTVKEACPFYMLIAPPEEVTCAFLEDRIGKFYRDVFSGGSFIGPYNEHLAGEMELFHAEKTLLSILAIYIRDSCRGSSGDARREAVLTGLFERGVINNRESRRFYRKAIKSALLPTQTLINECVDTFLLGKSVSFKIDDLRQVVRKMSEVPSAGIPEHYSLL